MDNHTAGTRLEEFLLVLEEHAPELHATTAASIKEAIRRREGAKIVRAALDAALEVADNATDDDRWGVRQAINDLRFRDQSDPGPARRAHEKAWDAATDFHQRARFAPVWQKKECELHAECAWKAKWAAEIAMAAAEHDLGSVAQAMTRSCRGRPGLHRMCSALVPSV